MSTLYVDNLAPNLGSRVSIPGHVVQVVSAEFGSGSNTTTTSSTRADTGMEVVITPTSTSSKIFVLAVLTGCGKNGGSGSGPYLELTLMRDSTDLVKFEGEGGYTANTSVNSFGSCVGSHLDSPASTSALTYKVQFRNPAGSGTVGFNNSGSRSRITVMEIAQ